MPDMSNNLAILIAEPFQKLREVIQQNPDIKLEKIILSPEEYLFRQGDPTDAIYFIFQGILNAEISQKNGKNVVVARMEAGDPVGELGLLVRGKRTASVRAVERAVLVRLAKTDFESLAERYPVIIEQMTDIIKSRLKRRLLVSALPNIFGPLNENMIKEIEDNITWISLKGNECLFRQGELDSSMYFVVSGRLRAYTESKNSRLKVLNEIVRGESIGELALITGKARTATIQAVRDCELVKLSKTAFEHIVMKYPQVMLAVSNIMLNRLQKSPKMPYTSRNCINIAVLTAGQWIVPHDFVSRLTTALVRLGPTLHLSEQILYDKLGTAAKDSLLETWLEDQESKYRFILFEVGNKVSAWSKWSVRQADHIVLVADAEGVPDCSEIEKSFLGEDDSRNSARQTLVLLHPDNTSLPTGTCEWLSLRNVDAYYHVRRKNSADYLRLARILAGKAVGLVLGGGGARGFAHIGVIKALEEAGVPIDLIGGTSMGSMIAGQYAMGWDYETMMQQNRELFINKKPLRDYTLPIISVLSGRKFDRMGQILYGDTCIEDLWINYFCVSCNLTTCDVHINRNGQIWKAIRASSSLPGILAPVMENNQPHIDGGILNNLPGDIMRQTDARAVIVVDVNPVDDMTYNWGKIPSPWKVLVSRILPFKKSIAVPGIMTVMMRTTIINSIYNTGNIKKSADVFLQPPVEDFGLLEFKSLDRIVDAGYTHTRDKLQQSEDWDFLK